MIEVRRMLKSTPQFKVEGGKEAEKSEELIVRCEGKEVVIKGDRLYTRMHMWAKKAVEGCFKVGLTDYAQKFIRGKVGLVEVFKNPTVGNDVEAGEVFGVVYGMPYANLDLMEWECMAFDLTAPLSGWIVEINHRVMERPQLINEDPYGEGWVAIIKPTENQSGLDDLITPKKYKKFLERRERSPFRIL